MAVTLGTDIEVHYDADGTFTAGAVEVLQVTSCSFDMNAPTVDTTNNDDAGWTSALYGNRSLSGSFSCRFDPAGSAIGSLMAAADGQVIIYLRFRPTGATSGDDSWHGAALVTSYSMGMDNAAPVDITFNWESTSSWTHTVVGTGQG